MRDPVFEPIKINRFESSNRIYMPAMHMGMADNYKVTDTLIEFYRERGKGGAGMICVGYATPDDMSGSALNIGAHSDEFIPGLKKLASAIKENGTGAVVQLNHSGRYNYSFFIGGRQPVAPSPVASRLTREVPKELTIDEIQQIVESFSQAAVRIRTAGFDAVEILAGTGYLISEFLSPLTNQRQDDYGGSLENRMRFGIEVVQSIRKSTGRDFPVIVRMNGNDFMQGGQGREELKIFAKSLVKNASVDALCINVGWHEARVPQIVTAVPRGAFSYLARGIKDVVEVPVIASHRINDSKTAREMIGDGMCDMVAIGRGLIADPYLPEKMRTGREKEIMHCIACAQGCFDNLFKLKPVACMCNPKAGFEKTKIIEKIATGKKVMVIGGGPAGMSAALSAAEKGHHVTLFEKKQILGGQLYLASSPPGREEFAEFARNLSVQVSVSNIDVKTGIDVDGNLIKAEKPDHIILATGAVPIEPPIKGHDLPHVVQAWDVLEEKVFTGRRIIIIGGGAVGVETALFLAEKGTITGETLKFLMVNNAEPLVDLYDLCLKGTKKVMIVEMLDTVGKDIGKSTRWGMMQDLSRVGVEINTQTKALEITEQGIKVDINGEVKEIPADTVVLAAGSKSYNPLQKIVENSGITYDVVGDAKQVALAFDAVHQGFDAGRSI
ncbi:MAG: FAD-dependent oxidoreductase [Proteobacteria bacterium]|nr:FAD-dependent oxidoreductase [Pseudomonadota bacterium]